MEKCPTGYRYRYNDLSACCKVSNEQCGADAAVSRQIVGGINATQGQWPWAVGIILSHACGFFVDGGQRRYECIVRNDNEKAMLSADTP